jgi:hypothetical protein
VNGLTLRADRNLILQFPPADNEVCDQPAVPKRGAGGVIAPVLRAGESYVYTAVYAAASAGCGS